MTLIHELDLKILKMQLQTTNEFSRSRLSKLRALQTDRQTDTQTDATEHITTPDKNQATEILKQSLKNAQTRLYTQYSY